MSSETIVEKERTISYEEEVEKIKNYIKGLNEYYKEGIMCSMSESCVGESVTEDILKYIHKIENGK